MYISEGCITIKNNLNFYLQIALWCLKGLKGFHKTFWGITKKSEIKDLSYFSLNVRDQDGKG